MAASSSKPSQLSPLPARMAQFKSLTLNYRLTSDILGLIAEAFCDWVSEGAEPSICVGLCLSGRSLPGQPSGGRTRFGTARVRIPEFVWAVAVISRACTVNLNSAPPPHPSLLQRSHLCICPQLESLWSLRWQAVLNLAGTGIAGHWASCFIGEENLFCVHFSCL